MFTQILVDQFRLLTFRRPSAAIATHWRAYLVFGLVVTWLVGIGRYWDHPRAHLWQHLGLGSVAYVLTLALVLWLLCWPLRPQRWSYRNVLLFVSLCSLPALLYAIPVERFMSLEAAQSTNAWFLAVVATWRIALLLHFLWRVAGLPILIVVIAALLPITLIVVALTALNLEHVVFDLMAGIRDENRSPHDVSYLVVLQITFLSMLASPVLLVAYLGAIWYRWRAASGLDAHHGNHEGRGRDDRSR